MVDPQLGQYVRPDSLDFRDRIFQPTLVEVPTEIPIERFRALGVPVLNQLPGSARGRSGVRRRVRQGAGNTSPHSTAWACTGFALATVAHYLLRHRAMRPDTSIVSEAMFFEMARRYDDYSGDRYLGSSARGAMKGWHMHGVCRQDLWTFRPDRRDRRLTAERATEAERRPLGAYFRVNHRDLVAMHCALAEIGVLYAVVNVHPGWLQARADGSIPPSNTTLGSHAIAIVAYDRRGFWIQNSWGEDWGSGGFGFLSYDDWLKNGVDAWAARLGVPMVLEEPDSAASIVASASVASRRQVMRQLRPHLVRIHGDGHLQSNDKYGTSAEDLDTIFEEDFPNTTRRWKKKRLLLYAGGGLSSLDSAVQRGVADYRASMLNQEIYPLAFVWHTGLWDAMTAVLRRVLSLRRSDSSAGFDSDFLLDRLDDAIEPQARREGGKLLWDEVKRTAHQGSALDEGGVRLTLDRIAGLVRRDPSVEVHVVAHSAGAMLLAPAVQLLTEAGRITSGPMKGVRGLRVPIRSCTLWAPACTTALFHQTYFRAIEQQRIRRFLLITLTEHSEAADNVSGIYRKSLLHLVSSALEEEARLPDATEGTEIMGMETCLRRHDEFRPGYVEFQRLLRRKSVRWMRSPAPATADPGGVTPPGARHHGDFDDDGGTLLATLGQILNRPPKDVRLAIHRSASSLKTFARSLTAG